MDQNKVKKCAICGKPETPQYKPFCCARCAQIDLGRWLGEAYVVPTEEEPEQDGVERGE